MQIPLELYKDIHASMPIPCVDIVLKQGGKILLGKRMNQPIKGQWWFPGGRVQKGETREEAVLRKAAEEIGVGVKVLKELGTDDTIFEDDGPFGWTTHTINSVYLVALEDDKELVLDAQHSEYEWFAEADDDAHDYLKKYFALVKE